jgi:hypothetical protein
LEIRLCSEGNKKENERKKKSVETENKASALLSALAFLLARPLYPQVGVVAHLALYRSLAVARLAFLADKRVCDLPVRYWKLAH